MNIGCLTCASNKNSLKLRLKSAENFSRRMRKLKFSALRGSSDSNWHLEFVWSPETSGTFFVTFLGQAKKVKKFKTHTIYSFTNNFIYSINF